MMKKIKSKLLLRFFIGTIMLGTIFVPTAFILTSCSSSNPNTIFKLSVNEGVDNANNSTLVMNDIDKGKITENDGKKYDTISLDFSNFSNFNGYTISLPSNIGDFSNITKLSIIGMPNAGFTLDAKSIARVSKMTHLKELTITGFSLVNVDFIKQLKQLEFVNFSNNNLTSINSLVSFNLPNLKHIDIHYNEINWIKATLDISNIPKLDYLNLNMNGTTNLPNSIIKWSQGALSLGIDLSGLPKDQSNFIKTNDHIKVFN